MKYTDIKKDYPNILEKVRQWDCSFEEAKQRLDNKDLTRWM